VSKLCVITNAFSADGFRLSGVEVHAAESAEVARATLLTLAKNADVGLIAIDANYYGTLDARTRESLDSQVKPVVIAIPASTRLAPAERRAEHIGDLVRRAIGLKITVRGGS
jgi:V/A-type H+/Na+-transporting ATPase subunit F